MNVGDFVNFPKSNIMLLGPTGVGKTLSIKTLAKYLKVPFYITNATQYSDTAYYGDDVDDMITGLLRFCNNNIELAQNGIVYIDEIDKIRKQGNVGRDVSGECVQNGLLSLIEGKKVQVPLNSKNKKNATEFVEVDTSKILFICGGAFVGLEDIILARTNSKSMGFGAEVSKKNPSKICEILKKANVEDFVKFGFIQEFIGRLPKVIPFRNLAIEDFVRILTEPKGSLIKEYIELFRYNGIELIFEKGALMAIAKLAIKEKTGARSFKAVIEECLEEAMYECFSDSLVKEYVITEDVINNCNLPETKTGGFFEEAGAI